jgi:hypothetical protein
MVFIEKQGLFLLKVPEGPEGMANYGKLHLAAGCDQLMAFA